jgi:hypothetical protein
MRRAAVRRTLAKLQDADDTDELFSRLESLRGGGEAPKREPEPTQPATSPVEPTETLEPGQRPGWPPPSQVAEFYPLAADLWSRVAERTKGTRFSLEPRKVLFEDLDGTRNELEVRPLDTLAAGTAPVLAQRVPEVATSPEAGLVIAVASVFGPALLEWAWEGLSTAWARWRARRAIPDSPETPAETTQ